MVLLILTVFLGKLLILYGSNLENLNKDAKKINHTKYGLFVGREKYFENFNHHGIYILKNKK